MEPIRTDFSGYEGKYVAIDARTGKIVFADDDPRVLLAKAKGRNHVVAHGRVPYPDEPLYMGGSTALLASLAAGASSTASSSPCGANTATAAKSSSYFNAACPAPKEANTASFPLATANFSFAGGEHLSVTVPKACRVKE